MARHEDDTRGRFAREDVRAVLARFGVASAKRAISRDPTEEVILLAPKDFARVEPAEVAVALMIVMPHTKIWVIEEASIWDTEEL